ncbi:MFS general substrate transporter, partial [Neoconidiobolus thromboides FSU 785]
NMTTNIEFKQKPLPYPQFFILMCVRFIEPVGFTILFPFVYFMVKDFNLTKDENMIGFYAGFISSSFAVAEFFSGVPWGILSDRIGRKPVIMMGLVGNCITMLMFGMSKNIYWAILSRFACGILNGNIGVLKSMIGEMSDRTNRAEAFGYASLMFGIGSIFGPIIGGFLSNPVKNYPNIFGGNEFLAYYPYFLPCAFASVLCFLGVIFVHIYLEETLTSLKTKLKNDEVDNENEAPLLNESNSNSNYSSIGEDLESNGIKEDQNISITTWYVILANIGLSLMTVILEELFPFWAATKIMKGGLSFTTYQIGIVLSFAGVVLMVFQLLIFPSLQRKVGTLKLFQLTYIVYGPILLLLPFVNYFASNGYTHMLWVALFVIFGIRSCCGCIAFTAYNILLPESCPNKNILGKVNGISQALGSLMRGVGPSICGIFYSWSLSNSTFPFDYHFTFII